MPERTDKIAALIAPFPAQRIKWLLIKDYGDGKALVAPYINRFAILQRLDDVLGPDNWQTHLHIGARGVVVDLSLRFEPDGEWVTKSGIADFTDPGDDNDNPRDKRGRVAVKGGGSNAIKRAFETWGGWYLHRLPKMVATTRQSKSGKAAIDRAPELPDWALPGGTGWPNEAAPETRQARPAHRPAPAHQSPPSATDLPASAQSPNPDAPGCKKCGQVMLWEAYRNGGGYWKCPGDCRFSLPSDWKSRMKT